MQVAFELGLEREKNLEQRWRDGRVSWAGGTAWAKPDAGGLHDIWEKKLPEALELPYAYM